MNLGNGPCLSIWVVKNLLQHLKISNVHQFNVERPDAKQSSSVVTLVQIPKSIHWVSDSISCEKVVEMTENRNSGSRGWEAVVPPASVEEVEKEHEEKAGRKKQMEHC